jgi:hypothetical protein
MFGKQFVKTKKEWTLHDSVIVSEYKIGSNSFTYHASDLNSEIGRDTLINSQKVKISNLYESGFLLSSHKIRLFKGNYTLQFYLKAQNINLDTLAKIEILNVEPSKTSNIVYMKKSDFYKTKDNYKKFEVNFEIPKRSLVDIEIKIESYGKADLLFDKLIITSNKVVFQNKKLRL